MGAIAFRLMGLMYLELRRATGSAAGDVHAVIYGAGQTGMQLALAARRVGPAGVGVR